MDFDFEQLVRYAAERKASDIFIKEGSPPYVRLRGDVLPTPYGQLGGEDTKKIAYGMMSEGQIAQFERRHDMDLGFTVGNITRLRVNVFQERGSIGIVMRLIPLEIHTIDELLLPTVLKDIVRHKMGMVLVTGPTGCGKSTTLAAMLDEINAYRPCNIVTVEDPIEFVHKDKTSICIQREVGIDTETFEDALKYILRESPDVILIGEMRDVATFTIAMAAAETGHLVFSTVHTRSAAETLDRIVSMFQPHERDQVCKRLSESLKAIVSQKLVPRKDGTGRVCAMEILIVTPTVAKLLEEGRTGEIYQAIKEGEFWQMQTMNQALDKFYKQGLISEDDALLNAGNLTELKQMLRREEPTATAAAARRSV